MEEASIEMFDSILRLDNIVVDYAIDSEPQGLTDYLEGWRMKLWDHAYTGMFKGMRLLSETPYLTYTSTTYVNTTVKIKVKQ